MKPRFDSLTCEALPASLAALLAALVLLASAPPAAGHRQHATMTELVWNERDGSLEITHRLHAHDALSVMQAQLEDPDARLSDVETRARLALHVAEQFGLRHLPTQAAEDPETIDLEVIGAELDGEHVNVYQEATLNRPPRALHVRCQILRDAFTDATNLVNLELPGRPVRTLRFAGDTDTRTYRPGMSKPR